MQVVVFRGLRAAFFLDCSPAFDSPLGFIGAAPEAVGLIAGLHDMTVMRQPIQERNIILAFSNTLDHRADVRLVLINTPVCLCSLDSM